MSLSRELVSQTLPEGSPVPRLPTKDERDAIVRASMLHSSNARIDIEGWMSLVAVFDGYCPDSPGYCGRVAVVVWSGGASMATTFGFSADCERLHEAGAAYVLGESQ